MGRYIYQVYKICGKNIEQIEVSGHEEYGGELTDKEKKSKCTVVEFHHDSGGAIHDLAKFFSDPHKYLKSKHRGVTIRILKSGVKETSRRRRSRRSRRPRRSRRSRRSRKIRGILSKHPVY
jgi:hypothetical protein